MNKLLVLCVLFACLLSFSQVHSLKNFIRGRNFRQNKISNYKPISSTPIVDLYYDQRLDHFDESQKATWKQRYWVNDEFFDGTGPVFLMIGGEGEENPIWMTRGQWVVYGKQFGALLVMLEHRYYGKSHPTEDLSTSNLHYLSSEQGLADLAKFRNFLYENYKLTEDNKLISFGGSYPGSLSAWFRLKYPHLVHAAVASSAPMLAVIDFSDYLVIVNQSLNSYSPDCTAQVSLATKQVQELMRTQSGINKLQDIFKTCDPIVTDDDITNFYSEISGNIEDVVQYNKDNRISGKGLTIDLICDIMMNKSIGDPLTRYAQVNAVSLAHNQQKCLDNTYASFLEQMTETSWNQSAPAARQWVYQTCVEFGFFQSTTSSQQPFGDTVPVEFYIQQCKDIYGDRFDIGLLQQAVMDTNTNYGGYNFQGTRVVFVNGEIDPWHSLGFYKYPPNQYTETVFIKGTAHCADMYPSGDDDLPQLVEARIRIGNLLYDWLKLD